MDVPEALEALRAAIRREAARELMKLHDESGRAVRPGLWLAATTLDPSLSEFGTED